MVWRLISNCWYSLIVNGQADDFFGSFRGVRQRNPLSLSLFIIVPEVLSMGLKELVDSKQIASYICAKRL